MLIGHEARCKAYKKTSMDGGTHLSCAPVSWGHPVGHSFTIKPAIGEGLAEIEDLDDLCGLTAISHHFSQYSLLTQFRHCKLQIKILMLKKHPFTVPNLSLQYNKLGTCVKLQRRICSPLGILHCSGPILDAFKGTTRNNSPYEVCVCTGRLKLDLPLFREKGFLSRHYVKKVSLKRTRYRYRRTTRLQSRVRKLSAIWDILVPSELDLNIFSRNSKSWATLSLL